MKILLIAVGVALISAVLIISVIYGLLRLFAPESIDEPIPPVLRCGCCGQKFYPRTDEGHLATCPFYQKSKLPEGAEL